MSTGIFSQNTAERRKMILNGPVMPSILLLSVPSMLMGIVQSSMPLIDGLFVNNIVGTLAAGSVTYCGPVIMMAAAAAQGLSVAGMSIIGQMTGRGEISHAKYVSTQIIVLAFLLGCVLAPFMFILSFPISGSVNSEISSDVFLYLSLNSLVLPFFFIEAVYDAVNNSSGKPESTFIRMVYLLILKVIFNFLFIYFIPLGIVGAVLASFFANLFISLRMYYEMFLKISDDKLELKGFTFDMEVVREVAHIGFPAILSSLMLNFGFFLINNEVEKYGPVCLNGFGIANNITDICFIIPASFGSAVTTMVSMNVGARNGRRAFKSCMAGCAASSVTAAIIIALVVPLSHYITMLFTRQQDVLHVANKALGIYTYSAIGFGICMVELGAFIGIGRKVMPLIMGIIQVWLLRYLFILATERFLGVYAVFWGSLFSNYAAAAIITVFFLRIKWISAVLGDLKRSE